MKKSLRVISHRNPLIRKGDIVRVTDGSAFTYIQDTTLVVFIVFPYPELTGSTTKIKDLEAEVIETDITDMISSSSLDIAYLQDIIVKIGDGFFRTSSGMVREI
jgi:hypothetical protein